MQQVPIYVSNGDFWGEFEKLGDQTYGQAVTLDTALKDKLNDDADECEPIGDYGAIFHWRKMCCCSVPRTLVMVGCLRDNKRYCKVLLLYNSRSKRGFKAASDECEKEFLFISKD